MHKKKEILRKTILATMLMGTFAFAIAGCTKINNTNNATGSAVSGGVVSGGPGAEKPDGKPGEKPDGKPGQGGPGASSAKDIAYSALKEIKKDDTVDGQSLEVKKTDQSGIWVSEGANATVKNVNINMKSTDNTGGDDASFYGLGAAALVTKGSLKYTSGSINSDAKGGAGVFAYGQGLADIADLNIVTTESCSGGIHVAGGGKLYAKNVNATTSGESSAAIRSDRGGGTMIVEGGNFITNGKGSPAIYSTADIAVKSASLTANNSEAICVEGKNSIHLFDSNLIGNMPESSQNDCTWNVILYQSMSGDSQEGNSVFEMNGGNLTGNKGGMFYTTNTKSTFIIKNVNINYSNEKDSFFLKCTGNKNQRGWGTQGSNGADCDFTAIQQEMKGNIVWDTISKLDYYITDNSKLTGAFVNDESAATSGSGQGYCNLYIDINSTWVVTENSSLSKLSSKGSIVDESGKSVTIKDTQGKEIVKGDSQYTITVKEFSESVDVSGAATETNPKDYEKEE